MVHCPGCNGDTSISPANPWGHLLGCGWHTPDPTHHPPEPNYGSQGWLSPWSRLPLALDKVAEALGKRGCEVTREEVADSLREGLDWWRGQSGATGDPRPPSGSSSPPAFPRLWIFLAVALSVVATFLVDRVLLGGFVAP